MKGESKMTKAEFIDKHFPKLPDGRTSYIMYKDIRKSIGESLDQLLQAEREECAKDILNQYYDICKKDDSGLSAYKMQKLIKYIITIRNKK